jgi:hypothetical protein
MKLITIGINDKGRDGLINTEGKIFWSDELVNRPEKQ